MIVFIWILLCFVVAHYASKKGDNPVAYFFVSLIISPLIGAIILAISKDRSEEMNINNKVLKKCPKCAEVIKYEAVKCKFCSESFE